MNNPNYERESANAVLDLLSLAGGQEICCPSCGGLDLTRELAPPSALWADTHVHSHCRGGIPDRIATAKPRDRSCKAWLRTSSQTLDRETGCGFTLSFLPCLEKVQCLCSFQGSQTGRQGKSRFFPCPYLLTASKRSLD